MALCVISELSNLRVLRLQHNLLTSVPSAALRYHLPHLSSLNLAGNKLSGIGNEAFSGLVSLETLDLTSCRLSAMDPAALRGLPTLKELKLQDNNLSAIPVKQFR